MTLRTRRIFFWALIPTFVVAGAAAVLYSQGYRVDLATRQVTKVGALYVRGYPRSARITLDGDPLNTGSWWPLQSGTLAGSLVPGSYRLHAEADGYRDWDADIVVRPSLVTERKSLVLFPSASTLAPIRATSTLTVLAAPDRVDGPLLSATEAGMPVTRFGAKTVAGSYVGVAEGRIVTASAAAATRDRAGSQTLRFQAPDETAATTAAFTGTVLGVMDDSVLVRESDRLVAAYDASSGARSVVASSSSPVEAVLRTSSFDAWSTAGASSSVTIQRRGGTSRQTVAIPDVVSLDVSGPLIGARDKAGSLWLIDPSSGTAREVAHRATYASWRPDGSSVAAVIDGGIEVIALKSDATHGKLVGALQAGEVPEGIAWYPDGEHLFVQLKSAILFVDVIDGAEAEQHTYRMTRFGPWAFSDRERVLYLAQEDGTIQEYAFPN